MIFFDFFFNYFLLWFNDGRGRLFIAWDKSVFLCQANAECVLTKAVDRYFTSHFSLTVRLMQQGCEDIPRWCLWYWTSSFFGRWGGKKDNVRDTGIKAGVKMKSCSCKYTRFGWPLSLQAWVHMKKFNCVPHLFPTLAYMRHHLVNDERARSFHIVFLVLSN